MKNIIILNKISEKERVISPVIIGVKLNTVPSVDILALSSG